MSRYLVVAASITILVLTGCGRGPEGPQGAAGGRDPQRGARACNGLKKTAAAAAVAAEGRFAMKTVAEVIGVARSNLIERLQERPKRRIGRRYRTAIWCRRSRR